MFEDVEVSSDECIAVLERAKFQSRGTEISNTTLERDGIRIVVPTTHRLDPLVLENILGDARMTLATFLVLLIDVRVRPDDDPTRTGKRRKRVVGDSER